MTTLGAWGPMKVGFDAAAAAEGWARMDRFFRTYLG
jgi:dienelactone hydrolase